MKGKNFIKRALIIQSFMPLFIILLIKYFDKNLIRLTIKFFRVLPETPMSAFSEAVNSSFFFTWLLELICIIWIIWSVITIVQFRSIQNFGFNSQGETIYSVEDVSDSSVMFFMTFVLPMVLDDIGSPQGLILFLFIIVLLCVLMWKTNLYYQNPVLTILGYKILQFQFKNTELQAFKGRECIGITRGNWFKNEDSSVESLKESIQIKRQYLSDNVFLVYKDDISAGKSLQNNK